MSLYGCELFNYSSNTFHRARIKLMRHTSDLYMGGSILTATDKLKYLGVIIHDKITWILHITYVKNKVVVVVCHDQVRRQVSQGFRCRGS